MKKLLVAGLFLTGFALVAWGGISLYNQFKLLMDYCFSPVGYRIISLTSRKFIFEIDLQIKNKSSISVGIVGYDFDITVNGVHATKVKSKTNQVLAANGFSILTMLVEFDPKTVFKNLGTLETLTQIIARPEEMKIGFSGTVSIDVEGIQVKDYEYVDEYSLKEMMPDKNNPSPPCK